MLDVCNPIKSGHARSAALTRARQICIGTRRSSGSVREPAGGQCARGCVPPFSPPPAIRLQIKHEKTKKEKGRDARAGTSARGHLSDTNLLLVLVGGGSLLSRGSPSPQIPPLRLFLLHRKSATCPRAPDCSLAAGWRVLAGWIRVNLRPRGPHPLPLLACFRDARLRLRARRDGTPSLLATCCHSNPPGGSQRRLLLPTEAFFTICW